MSTDSESSVRLKAEWLMNETDDKYIQNVKLMVNTEHLCRHNTFWFTSELE